MANNGESDIKDANAARLTTDNSAVYQNFKLYVEGEECPFESVSVSYGVGIIPEMVIQLVPFQILRDLGEGTRAHLYFVDPVDQQQRLLFDGEISGVGYTKNPTSQVLTYTVSHVSRQLDEILVSFFDLSSYAMSIPPLYIESSGAQLSLDYSMFEYGTLEKLLSPGPVLSSGRIKSFQDIFRMFFDEIYKTKNATIDFYKKKIDEWQLERRFVVLSLAGEGGSPDAALTLKNFIEENDLMSMLRNEIKKLDGMHSVFAVLREVFSQIFYVPLIIPTAYLKSDEQILQTIMYKPQTLFVLPPVCNVVWPSMYNVFSYSRNFKSIPTRMFARIDPNKIYTTKDQADTGVPEYAVQYVWSPKEVRDEIDGKAKHITRGNEKEAKKALSKSMAIASGRAKGKPGHERLLDVITDEEEAVGVRLTQPDRNGLFVRYVEYLERTTSSKNKNEEKIHKLLDYELTRQRFETSATSINMVFNPYLVPGFPCLIMDRPESGMHVYGYVVSVMHSIAKGNVGTSAEIGYVRRYDESVANKFFVAEDAWSDEGEIYNTILGVPSIKDAPYNTMEDDKKRGNTVDVAKHFEEAMKSGTFYDYISNAYVRSRRSIVTKEEYDKFIKDLKYDAGVQEKVKKYRLWVASRVAICNYDEKKEK